MYPYEDSPELHTLHQHWLTVQARMLEAHKAAREFESRLSDSEPVAPEELVGGADLAARARDAAEIWLRIDSRFTQANSAHLEKQRRVFVSSQ